MQVDCASAVWPRKRSARPRANVEETMMCATDVNNGGEKEVKGQDSQDSRPLPTVLQSSEGKLLD